MSQPTHQPDRRSRTAQLTRLAREDAETAFAEPAPRIVRRRLRRALYAHVR